MVMQYLQGAIADLRTLIDYTKQDIESIKLAKHDEIFERNPKKDALIKEFETKKSLISQEMLALKNNNPQKEIKDLIDSRTQELFDEMSQALKELKKLNSSYAQIVFAVSEFFTSLMDKLIPKEAQTYGDKKSTPKSSINLLQIKA
ncbi:MULTISPECIES: flagellar export chaperone FlgN [Helicobacter]|uniref:Flagellar protein FlgN n=1 Tax=Helicobacter macacae MIT 99-5501 TaxID=1357400 RepID=V8C7L8_9HELI|nr:MULTISPECIES: flagellar export chaperone FlgN [Helicobacter]ETD22741.1 hypothetical protein HMPREF2086_01540 [Helicobacter macacae MIT 99-5501]RDU53424.1 hypothetical protein CQA40_05590 [Helicobacter sp. MIT 01-3238]